METLLEITVQKESPPSHEPIYRRTKDGHFFFKSISEKQCIMIMTKNHLEICTAPIACMYKVRTHKTKDYDFNEAMETTYKRLKQ